MKNVSRALPLILLLSITCLAQDSVSTKVDEYIRAQMQRFGWGLGEVRGHRIIEHGGAWQEFKAQISRFVDDRLTIIVFANQIRANQTKLARGVAALFNPDLAQN